MRILLVTYYFPPFNSVGAMRPGKLAAYLQAQGHDVQVLTCSNQPYPEGLALELPANHVSATPAWSVNAPIEWVLGGREKVASEGFAGGAPRPAVARLGYVYRTLLHWPDAQRGWVAGAVRKGRELLGARTFDLIYATAPPYSTLRVAAELAGASGVPLVVEFRDLWTDNHSYAYPAWRRWFERRREDALLRTASALVTVSEPLAAKLARHGKPVWVVRNGCDPEDFEGLLRPEEMQRDADTLDIVFTGNVYPRYYDTRLFCEGLRRFLQEGGKARVHVMGRNIAALRQAAEAAGVSACFRFQATVPRRTALAMQRHADLLLFFLWQGATGEGVFSLKLFEYAGAGRPVLAVGTQQSDVASLIGEARLGEVCGDVAYLASRLHAFQAEKRRVGRIERAPTPVSVDLTRRTQFARLERGLLQLLAEGH